LDHRSNTPIPPRHGRRLPHVVAALIAAGLLSTSATAAPQSHLDSLSVRLASTAKRALVSVVTSPVERRAAAAPLALVSSGPTSLSLAWSAPSEGARVDGYKVFLNSTRVATTTARAYTASRLACGRTYLVRVDAFDSTGRSRHVGTLTAATTPCRDAIPPVAPSSLRQASTGRTELVLEWAAASDDIGVAGYTVYREGVPLLTTQRTSAAVTGLVCGAAYTLTVDAFDASGNRSPRRSIIASTAACGDNTPPTVPRSVRVTGSTTSSISIAWQASEDDSAVAGYRTSVDGLPADATVATTKTFTGLRCGSSYTLAVSGFDAAGNESAAALTVAGTSPCPSGGAGDTTPPTSPENLSQAGGSSSSILLVWASASDDRGVAAYGVYRDGAKVAEPSATSYAVTGLACGSWYELAVDAVDGSGNRSSRRTLTAATASCDDTTPPPVPTGLRQTSRTETSVSLAWNATGGDTAGYRLFKNGALVGSTASTSFTFTALSCGTTFTFAVEAYDTAGNHSPRSTTMLATAACSDTTPPTPPAALQPTGATTTSVSLSWTPATDNVGVAGYSLYVGGTAVGTTQQTSYTFSSLTCGTQYSFGVEAFDAAGNRSSRLTVLAAPSTCTGSSDPSQATVWLKPGGSDATCTRNDRARPCGTFERAYELAAPGDTVLAESGTYNGATLPSAPAKASGAPVTISPACTAPNCVTVTGFFTVLASNVRISGNGNGRALGSSNFLIHKLVFAIAGARETWTRDVVASGLHTLTFFINGASDITLRDSEVGPFLACYGRSQPRRTVDGPDTVCPDDPPYYPYANTGSTAGGYEPKIGPDGAQVGSTPTNITLERLYFHDHNSSNIKNGDGEGGSFHSGCLFIVSGSNITVRSSIFRQCVVYDIQIQDFTTKDCCGMQYGPVRGLTLENNWFGQPVNAVGQAGTVVEGSCGASFSCRTNEVSDNQAAVQFSPRNVGSAPSPYWRDILIRFNSIQGGIFWSDGSDTTMTFSNVRVVGNAGRGNINVGANCANTPGLVYDFNAFTNTVCGDPDSVLLSSSPFVSESIPNPNLRLNALTPARGLVKATGGDFDLGVDFDGNLRGVPRNAGSG
jgi:chitodextrinase